MGCIQPCISWIPINVLELFCWPMTPWPTLWSPTPIGNLPIKAKQQPAKYFTSLLSLSGLWCSIAGEALTDTKHRQSKPQAYSCQLFLTCKVLLVLTCKGLQGQCEAQSGCENHSSIGLITELSLPLVINNVYMSELQLNSSPSTNLTTSAHKQTKLKCTVLCVCLNFPHRN